MRASERRRGPADGPGAARRWTGRAAAVLFVAVVASFAGRPAPAQEPAATPWPRSTFDFDFEGAAEGGAGAEGDDQSLLDFIDTDRNSLTPSTRTAGPGVGILEVAYTYLNFPSSGVKHSYPESLLRYGITERFELRLGWNYESGGEEDVVEGLITDYFGANAQQQIYYGFKALLVEQKALRPDVAFLIQGHTPTGGPATATQIRTGITSGWVLPNDWILDWATLFGTDSEQGDHFQAWFPMAVLKIPFARNRWFTHIEYFGAFSANKHENFARNFLDTGLHHLLTPDIEVGFILGMELHENPGYFLEVGLGLRF